MGATLSLAKLLRSMDDDELVSMIETAYHQDPQRIERVFSLAKMRYIERSNVSATPAASETVQSIGLDEQQQRQQQSGSAAAAAVATINEIDDAGGSKDPMNALWTFEGHTLRELLPLDKNPQHVSSQRSSQSQSHPLPNSSDGDDAMTTTSRQLDADGQPLLYGSCGRDKRYARCSVCYFRGLRSNAAHYCSCCQRPVCIRPRTYPNESHAKICWNVLHMDKDMVSRVEKKKRRRLHVAATTSSPNGTTAVAAASDHSILRPVDASSSLPQRPSTAAAAAVAVATAALDL